MIFLSPETNLNIYGLKYNRIRENRTGKLLGITIDNELKFDEHLSNACLKANRKLSVLTRIRKYLVLRK